MLSVRRYGTATVGEMAGYRRLLVRLGETRVEEHDSVACFGDGTIEVLEPRLRGAYLEAFPVFVGEIEAVDPAGRRRWKMMVVEKR